MFLRDRLCGPVVCVDNGSAYIIDICWSRLQQNKLTDTALHTVDMHALHTVMSCTYAAVALHTVDMHVLHTVLSPPCCLLHT